MNGGIPAYLRVYRKQLVWRDAAARRTRDNVGERTTPVDPGIPPFVAVCPHRHSPVHSELSKCPVASTCPASRELMAPIRGSESARLRSWCAWRLPAGHASNPWRFATSGKRRPRRGGMWLRFPRIGANPWPTRATRPCTWLTRFPTSTCFHQRRAPPALMPIAARMISPVVRSR